MLGVCCLSAVGELSREAFLEGPGLCVVVCGVDLELFHVGGDEFSLALGTLQISQSNSSFSWYSNLDCMGRRTLTRAFGALTGTPLALTGALVPAASAFLCSRW